MDGIVFFTQRLDNNHIQAIGAGIDHKQEVTQGDIGGYWGARVG
jgi:hypothetical protein